MRGVLLAVVLAAALPASAQLDFGRILDLGKKAVEVGQKAQEATKEYTVEEEVALGEGIASGFLGAARLHPDERLQRYVNRVGRWLAMHAERPDLPWVFGVIDNDAINAFAMPGGTVIVSLGLVKRLTSESELAGVLAHEIAHVVHKHQLSAIKSDAGWSAVAMGAKTYAADRIGRSGDALGLKSRLADAGVDLVKDGLFLRPLDRSMEYEADRDGAVIAARAGYDPNGIVAVLTMLAQVKPEESGASIMFSTHPSPTDRLGQLEKVMSKGLEKFAGHPQVEGRFRSTVDAK